MTAPDTGKEIPEDTDNTPNPEDGPQDLPQAPDVPVPGWVDPDEPEAV